MAIAIDFIQETTIKMLLYMSLHPKINNGTELNETKQHQTESLLQGKANGNELKYIKFPQQDKLYKSAWPINYATIQIVLCGNKLTHTCNPVSFYNMGPVFH